MKLCTKWVIAVTCVWHYRSEGNMRATAVLLISLLIFCNVCIVSASKRKDGGNREFVDSEKKRHTSAGHSCPLKKITPKGLTNLRLTKSIDSSIACYLAAVGEDINNGYLWASLGHLYNQKKSVTQANTCFKTASKLVGKISPDVNEWQYIGPFVIGKIELDGDPLHAYGGIKNVSKFRFHKNERFYSELVEGGEISWKTYKPSSPGQVVQITPQVNWNDLVNSLGSVGITEWQGWVVGEIIVTEKDQNIVIQCLGVHTLYVDDLPLTGDVYHREKFWFGVQLSPGIHTVSIPLRTKVTANFKCSFKVQSSAISVLHPHYLPDLLEGYIISGLIAVPISNGHHSKWIKVSKVVAIEQDGGDAKVIAILQTPVSIAPGQILPVIVKLKSEDKVVSKCSDDERVKLQLKFTTSDGIFQLPITLRCRRLDQSFLFTFLDHDNSIQHAAAIPPIGSCPENLCPVVLTLHGTTVPPQNQADSYKRMVDQSFVFGAEKAWVLAPTRHGAHNWEGPGALTALTSLSALDSITQGCPWITQKVDTNKVVYAGHSMGGHGAWHLATHYPDRAIALITLAGWIKKEEYGDSNLFFRHDISTSHVDPAVKFIMEACIAENDADRHVSNIQDIPVMARIGQNDRTVHPFFVRRMYRLLKEIGVMINYTELAGKEHWWWDTWETNDGGVVNDKQLRQFTNTYVTKSLDKQGACSSSDRSGECESTEKSSSKYREPDHKETESFLLTTYNPALGDGLNGVRITQQIVPFRKSEIKGAIQEKLVHLTTLNVARIQLQEPPNRPIQWWNKDLQIDGTLIGMPGQSQDESSKTRYLCLESGKWIWCDSTTDGRQEDTYGPARRVAEKPFLIVTGTQGNHTYTQWIQQAAVYIANLFFLTSDTIAAIVRDDDLDSTSLENNNLILIGSPSENSHVKEFLEKIPFSFHDSENSYMQLESCIFRESRSGLLSLAPNGNKHLALLLMANSLEGLMDVITLAKPTIPPMTRSPFSNLIPDYIVTGPEFGLKGLGGYLCAGFYGNKWEYRSDISSCVCQY